MRQRRREMGRIAAYLLVGIGVGLGFAWWQGGGQATGAPESGLAAADSAPLAERLSELETSLALERYERQALADELAALRAMLEGAAGAGRGDDAREPLVARADADADSRAQAQERVREFRERSPEELDAFRRQRQIDNFVEAGFRPDRAQWLLQREEELEMAALEARYQAARDGASEAEIAELTPSALLREELGDAEYERYLEGRGRPTTINVRDVLTNSPAEAAGLVPGDEIVAYNGKRVFDMSELNELTLESQPGEAVALEVLREGQHIQVYVAGGPVGISGGGRSTRRRGSARR